MDWINLLVDWAPELLAAVGLGGVGLVAVGVRQLVQAKRAEELVKTLAVVEGVEDVLQDLPHMLEEHVAQGVSKASADAVREAAIATLRKAAFRAGVPDEVRDLVQIVRAGRKPPPPADDDRENRGR